MDTSPERPAGRSHRRGLAVILVLVGAAGSAGSAFLPWWSRVYHDPLSGDMTVTVDGTDVAVALVPLALVMVAGLAAAMISRGIARRLLGAVVALAAVASAISAVMAAAHTPYAEFAAKLARPAMPLAAPETHWTTVVLAATAALAAAAGGVLVCLSGGRPRDARRSAVAVYRTPAAQRDAVRKAAQIHASAHGIAGRNADSAADQDAAQASDQVDPGQWWQALDAGVDPTDEAGSA